MPFLFVVENVPRKQGRDSAAFIHCEAQLHVLPRRHKQWKICPQLTSTLKLFHLFISQLK